VPVAYSTGSSMIQHSATVVLVTALIISAILALPFALMLWPWRRAKRHVGNRVRIAFVHPDLGIGGAERLVVDAAVALQRAGHDVCMYTARHEPTHCFEETKDGTLLVVVYGSFLPRRILGRFYAACAYLRMCWVSFRLVLHAFVSPFDVFFVDQVSVCIPILWLARPCGIVFYCHYPDYLLTQRASLLKWLYRAPLDLLEEWTTGLAQVIFVNSKFTANIFADAFPLLHRRGVVPTILYPGLNLCQEDVRAAHSESRPDILQDGEQLLLSINRFERKKNIGLAVRTFAALPRETRDSSRLVIAGGYDERLPENVEHARELRILAEKLGVAGRVMQIRSCPGSLKATMLRHASCLLYTPDKEHFGIVPLEAMYARVPVLAVNSGGPLESICEGETGFLRPSDPDAWADVVGRLLVDRNLQRRMGEAGRSRVKEHFSLELFGSTLDAHIKLLVSCGGGDMTTRPRC